MGIQSHPVKLREPNFTYTFNCCLITRSTEAENGPQDRSIRLFKQKPSPCRPAFTFVGIADLASYYIHVTIQKDNLLEVLIVLEIFLIYLVLLKLQVITNAKMTILKLKTK